MSDYKNKVIFSSEKPQSEQPEHQVENGSESRSYQQSFKGFNPTHEQGFETKIEFAGDNEFVPMTQAQMDLTEQQSVEDQMVEIIRPKSKRRKWFALGLVTFSGLVAWQSVESVVQAYQQQDWLSLGWTGFIAGIASLGIVATVKELWKLHRLRKQLSSQELAMDLIYSHQTGNAKPFCENLASEAGVTLEHAGFDRWTKTVNENHNDADVIELYDDMVIAQQDKQAKKVVASYATESAVLVALSPLAIADMLLVAWRNFKMIDDLGKIYGVELGYWSRVRLLKLVFINMAAAGASELVVDVGANVMSMNLAGKISTKAAQGIGVGLLTGRLGIKAMALLRPLPWRKDKAVRLGEIRKLVVGRVIGKSQDKE
ncbi:MAG: YcjF family protein [Vibrio sp.]